MLRRVLFYGLMAFLAFIFLLCGTLYYLLWTTSGSQFVFKKSQELTADYISLEGEIESGNIAQGFKTKGELKVVVPEVVTVQMDSADIKWSLWHYLTSGILIADYIKVPHLEVILHDECFMPTVDDSEAAEDPDEEPFRLDIPIRAKIEHLISSNFAFRSQIVDVLVDDLDLSASCFKDYAGVQRGRLKDVEVQLKLEEYDSKQEQYVKDLINKLKKEGKLTAELEKEFGGQSAANAEPCQDPAKHAPATFGPQGIEFFPTIDLPLDTELRDLLITRGRYHMEGFDTGIFDAYVDAGWLGHKLTVNKTAVAHAYGKAQVSGVMDFKDHFGLDFKLRAKGDDTEVACKAFGGLICSLEGTGSVKGQLSDFTAQVNLTAPQSLKVKARLNVLADNIPLEASVSSKLFSYPLYIPKDFAGQFEKAKLSVGGDDTDVDGSSKNLDKDEDDSLDIKLNIPANAQGIVAQDLDASFKGEILADFNADLKTTLTGYGLSDAKTTIHLSSKDDEKDPDLIALKGSYMDVPFEASVKGQMLSGLDALSAFSSILDADLDELAENFALDLDDDETNNLDKDQVANNNEDSSSELIAQDNAKLAPFEVVFDFKSKNGASISQFLQGPASLHSAFTVAKNDEQQIFAKISDFDLDAVLDGVKTKIKANAVDYQNQSLSFDKFSLVQDENSILADGTLSAESSLDVRIKLKKLKSILPDLSGSLAGTLHLSGMPMAPDAELYANSKELSYQDISLRGLTVNARANSHNKSLGVTLFTDSLRFSEKLKPSKKCMLDLAGTLSSHHFNFGCSGKNSGFISISGGISDKDPIWSLDLQDFVLATEFGQNINLKRKVALSYNFDDGSLSFAPFTINSTFGNLDIGGGKLIDGNLKSSIKLSNFDLSSLQAYMDEDVKLSGIFTLDGVLGLENFEPLIEVKYNLARARILAHGAFFDFDSLSGNIDMSKGDLSLDLSSVFGRQSGSLDTNIKIHDPSGSKALSGSLSLRDFKLQRLSGLGNGFNELEGMANASLAFSGTLLNPMIDGSIKMSGAAEPRYDIGRLNSFDLALNAHGQTGDLVGTIGVNQGQLNLNGSLNWAEGANGQLHVVSNRLPLFLMGYGNCFANVDTTASFGDITKISGNVSIPKANIKVSGIGDSGITPSKDEIIIGKDGSAALIKDVRSRQHNGDGIELDLRVDVGPDIKLEAMGLKSGVVGGVELKKQADEYDIKAVGKVSLVNGRADLYGHRFIVSYADSIFDGNIASPKISAEVIADPSGIEDDVEAGVRVSGIATDPNIELFSRPSMSQNEILSYLLYGHGLEKNTNDPDSSSATLLMALGLGTTTGLMNSITSAMGMSNVQFQSSGSGEETQVGVQTYLTNKIMMSYGYGVFTSVGEFKLRYELMRKLYAEFVSSLDQAVDLIYSFEFD